MKSILSTLTLGALLSAPSIVHAQGAMLRVTCAASDVGAEVTVDGKFKGECSLDTLDIQVRAGTVKLRVVRKDDARSERVFEQDVRVGEGVTKRVEAALSAPRLNAEGQRLESERLAVERAIAAKREEAHRASLAAELHRYEQPLASQRAAAAAGDSAAMNTMGDRYASGTGVGKDSAEALAWYRKAAAAGSGIAAYKLSGSYKNGKREDVEDSLHILSLPIAQQRNVMVKGEANIHAFIESDPFFAFPDGNQKISYLQKSAAGSGIHHTCAGKGRFVQFDFKTEAGTSGLSMTSEGLAVLGGMVPFQGKSSIVTQASVKTSRSELSQIASVNGQPFPLTPGKRFGITHTTVSSGANSVVATWKLSCAISAVIVRPSAQADDAQTAYIVCLSENQDPELHGFSFVTRSVWNSAAGCFVAL